MKVKREFLLSFKGGAGFTLMEVLVAMGLFTILGLSATAFLLAGVKSWRVAESRRDAAERAELMFSRLREDMRCLYNDSSEARLKALVYSDYDKEGRQRLYLTRTVPPPGDDPRIAFGGRTMMGRDEIDGVADLRNLKKGRLASPGDLVSVLYFFSGKEKLYRASVTPARNYSNFSAGQWLKGGNLLADGVMHIEYNFWSPETNALTAGQGKFGPSYFWDSSMGLGKEKARPGASERRLVFKGSGSAKSPEDDVFPRLVEVKVVLSKNYYRGFTCLTEEVRPHSESLPVQKTEGYRPEEGEEFVKLDSEWISYEKVSSDGKELLGLKRGRRGTKPALHKAGTVVRYGIEFRTLIRPVCQREPWHTGKQIDRRTARR